jgi:hypothetical protein
LKNPTLLCAALINLGVPPNSQKAEYLRKFFCLATEILVYYMSILDVFCFSDYLTLGNLRYIKTSDIRDHSTGGVKLQAFNQQNPQFSNAVIKSTGGKAKPTQVIMRA